MKIVVENILSHRFYNLQKSKNEKRTRIKKYSERTLFQDR